jgi:hypothetical protein
VRASVGYRRASEEGIGGGHRRRASEGGKGPWAGQPRACGLKPASLLQQHVRELFIGEKLASGRAYLCASFCEPRRSRPSVAPSRDVLENSLPLEN